MGWTTVGSWLKWLAALLPSIVTLVPTRLASSTARCAQ